MTFRFVCYPCIVTIYRLSKYVIFALSSNIRPVWLMQLMVNMFCWHCPRNAARAQVNLIDAQHPFAGRVGILFSVVLAHILEMFQMRVRARSLVRSPRDGHLRTRAMARIVGPHN